ncbi:MAG: hypothetical protein WAP03_21875 [Methylorubrum rhodinum]|uniref:hypothetical protein n=1 Tax=Methylorubrum rhodinum TaxID=29428 RepID=UPI003BB09758
METTGQLAFQDVLQRDEPIVADDRASDPLPVASGRVILGVDPGTSGAIAFYRPDRPREIEAVDVPTADGQIDAAALARLIREANTTEAMVERVGAMPKQGVSSTFKFGMAYGAVLATAAALEIPIRQATPQRWKKHFRLTADKEQARGLAIRQWPGSRAFARKKDHGRAETALLALFAVEVPR